MCAFLESVKSGELVTAGTDVAWNGGSIARANAIIADDVGLSAIGRPQVGTLATAHSRQFFIVYEGGSMSASRHVLVGIVNRGRAMLYDPQSGQRYYDIAAHGRFVAFPILF